MVPEQRVKTCTYQVCKMVPEQRVKTCTYTGVQDGARAAREDLHLHRFAAWCRENRVKTCTYKVCKMVPEQRVKTCTYQVCKMVPEQRVKTCTYTGVQDGARAAREDLHLPGLPHGAEGMPYQEIHLQGLQDGARAVRQASAVHGLQAGVLHEDDQLREAGAEASSLHGHALRAGGGLQAGSGAGLLPGPACPAGLLRSPEGLCPGWLRNLIPSRESMPS